MATGLEAVGAASTVVSIIGFSFQIFDGCVKGFVLLSTAGNLGRDADIFRSMLDWEQFRLEQWAERVNLQDPSKADMLMDWKLVADTLQHLENLTNDTSLLKEKYKLVLLDRAPSILKATDVPDDEKASISRFKRLFGQGEKYSSTAAAKVIQAKSSYPKKLWWAAVDKKSMKQLIDDIAHFVQRLHDLLNSSIQSQMKQSVDTLLHDATQRYQNVPDLEFLRELAARLKSTPTDCGKAEEEDIATEIDREFINLLFYHIQKGDIKEVELLLDKGFDVHANDNIGWSPMVRAAEYGQLAIIEILVKRGADPPKGTVGDRLPLHFAAEAGHLEVVRLLLKQPTVDPNQRDYTGQTALYKAADNGHLEVVKLLLQQKGIDPLAESKAGLTSLSRTIFGGRPKVVKLLLERADINPNQCDTYERTPLWMASTAGDEILGMFLERKDIEIDGQSRLGETPLYQAIQHKCLSAAKMLLDAGADPNVLTYEKKTALSWAAAKGSEESIELLLKQPGIELDIPDQFGQTPLLRSADAGHTKSIRMLLDKRANVKLADCEGRTALSLAAIKGHKVVAKLLLKNNADVNAQDKKGNTPLALAAEKDHDAVVRFLLENGADADLADEDEETPFEKARDRHMDQIVAVFKEVLKL